MKEGTIEAQVNAGVEAGVTSAFDKFKDLFVPKAKADLEKANDKVATLEKQVSDKDAEIVKLKGDLEKANQKAADAEKKAKDTEESVETRANQKALAIEQGRGVTTPVKGEEKPEGNGGGKTKAAEYRELLASDPVKAGAFYAKHRDEIFA